MASRRVVQRVAKSTVCMYRRLRRKPVLLLALIAAVLLGGCNATFGTPVAIDAPARITGSGNVVTKTLDFRDFRAVEAHNAFTVDISRAEAYAVQVTADDNLFDYLDVYQIGETLVIGLKKGSYSRGTWRATVAMPDLARLDVSGASRATVAGFASTDGVDFEVSGASKLVGRLQARRVALDVSGASTAELGGAAERLELEVGGASHAGLGDLAVDEARVRVSGASSATVNAGGSLDADLSGASTLYYVGSPSLGNITTSGASSLKRR